MFFLILLSFFGNRGNMDNNIYYMEMVARMKHTMVTTMAETDNNIIKNNMINTNINKN